MIAITFTVIMLVFAVGYGIDKEWISQDDAVFGAIGLALAYCAFGLIL